MIIQLITALLGALAFCLVLNVRGNKIIFATLGGFICWGVYLICDGFSLGIFLCSLIASAVCEIYSDVLARILKAPTTVFLIPSIIPLVPGGALYRLMAEIVSNNWDKCLIYLFDTLQFALGISVGISLVLAVSFTAGRIRNKYN